MTDYTPFLPQIIIIAMSLVGLFLTMANLDSTKPLKITGTSLLVVAIQYTCFWFAGIVQFSAPFIILVLLSIAGLGLIHKDQHTPREPRTASFELIMFLFLQSLYYWAGFYDIFLNKQ